MDGVFFGAQALIAPLARRGGGSIVATASLAGLIPFSADIVYTMTKHAVVGMVRSLAMALETRRITVNAVCPGFVDTPIIGEARDMFLSAGFPLLQPEDIAAAVRTIIETGRTGECWVCQPGRDPEPYRFHGVPGPRIEGKEGMIPPQLFGGEPE
jgi:NAD(P)-dependent dehydrogenase (short-subunit alcohol dehydrogenase family)